MNFLRRLAPPPRPAGTSAASESLPPGPSLLLDIARFAAAVMVAFGHISQRFFSQDTKDLTTYAIDAVSVFFVLSGFVIRHITRTRVGTLQSYAIDRVSRIYSVAFPALLLTLVLDAISHSANPGFYSKHWGQGLHHPVLGLVLNMLFLSQAWFHDVSPLSNSPFWSLGYECVYYAVYGAAFYLMGRAKVISLLLIFLFIGPTVFLAFPIWLLGVATYDVFAEGKLTFIGSMKLLVVASLAVVGIHGTYRLANHFHLPLVYQLLGRINPIYGPMDKVAIVTAALILGACWSVKNLRFNEKHWLVLAIRRLADSTFVLYLVHFPILVLVASTVPYNRSSWVARLVTLVGVVLFSVIISPWLDSLKKVMRKALSRELRIGRLPTSTEKVESRV
jgi:peptidoglycan/LPS O-acetylase OafA/YrhL